MEKFKREELIKLFITGAMVIFITVFVQFIMQKNNYFTNNLKEQPIRSARIVKALDHLFTATYYLQNNKLPESKVELEKARIFLRGPGVMQLRRSIEPLK